MCEREGLRERDIGVGEKGDERERGSKRVRGGSEVREREGLSECDLFGQREGLSHRQGF